MKNFFFIAAFFCSTFQAASAQVATNTGTEHGMKTIEDESGITADRVPYTAPQPDDVSTALSPSDKQAIEKEISALSRSFFVQVEKLDIDGCMRFFENTADFWSVNADGTAGDYNSLKKINGDGFSQMKSFSTTLNKESIRVLSKTQVLYTCFLTQAFVLKTGETMKMENIGETMLFEKMGNSWKATFYQESGAQPVQVK